MAELLFFAESFLVSYLLTGALLGFSLKRKLLDIPNDRSSHSIPTPRLGGMAIVVAFFATCATILALGVRPIAPSSALAGALGGGVVIAICGLLDDLRGLDARLKLLIQLGAAVIVVSSGIVLRTLQLPIVGTLELGALGVPVTLLWIVAVINFYNFIDGIDGLAAGIGVIASSFLFFISGLAGAAGFRGLYAALAGSSFGFLRFNFPPARIFMGDTGSTFIGYTFAVLAVAGEGIGIPAFLTVLLLASAIGDAALTLVRRALKRERLFSPHRTHYYQRLTSLGLSHKQVTLLEYLVAVLLGVSAVLAFRREWTFVTFLSVVWIGFFLWALAKIRSMERGNRLFWQGRTLGIAFGDLAFIATSYVLSYWLRLNFRFPQAETASMLMSLPIVLVIRTAIFYRYGLYRSVWRYTTFDDVIRIAKAVSIGSAVMVVAFTLLFRFRAFPRSAFIIDWFILIVFMAGSRIATRWFHELPSREEVAAKRVIIAGTGPAAELVLAQLKRMGGVNPIGCLDDRVEMTGRIVHGLTVIGTLARADETARRYRADEIVALSSFVGRMPRDVLASLEESGVELRVVTDPSELAQPPAVEDESPFNGASILVAGNGPLVERSQAVFAGASEIALVSNDGLALEGRAHTGAGGTACYLGVLNEVVGLRGIIERHRPQTVFADLTMRGISVANPMEAYIRTVLVPLERLAGETALQGLRLVAILRDDGPAHAVDAAELVIRDAFRGRPSHLVAVRIDHEPPPAEWRSILGPLLGREGGVYRVVRDDEAAGGFLVRTVERAIPPEARPRYLELMRSLDEGDGPSLERTLGEMVAAVREHVS